MNSKHTLRHCQAAIINRHGTENNTGQTTSQQAPPAFRHNRKNDVRYNESKSGNHRYGNQNCADVGANQQSQHTATKQQTGDIA